MTKHTPGPWNLIYRDIGGPFLESVAGPDGQKIRLIGVALSMGSRDVDPEPEANARLIAAAPELLNHLKQACRQWEMYADMVERDSEGRWNLKDEASPEGEMYRAALAAIAKAEGTPLSR